MKYSFSLDIEPEDEKVFLSEVLDGTHYMPIQHNFKLQDHLSLTFTSRQGDKQTVYCMIVGRCFDGPSRVPSKIRIRALQSQKGRILDLIDRLCDD